MGPAVAHSSPQSERIRPKSAASFFDSSVEA